MKSLIKNTGCNLEVCKNLFPKAMSARQLCKNQVQITKSTSKWQFFTNSIPTPHYSGMNTIFVSSHVWNRFVLWKVVQLLQQIAIFFRRRQLCYMHSFFSLFAIRSVELCSRRSRKIRCLCKDEATSNDVFLFCSSFPFPRDEVRITIRDHTSLVV